MFTIVLIALAAIALVTVVVHEVWAWRKPGRHISQQAPMDSSQNNMGRLTHQANIHGPGSFGGSSGGSSF